MTKINIKRQGDSYEITLEGHAGFREAGKDIVCAGISTLAFTLINCLKNLKEREQVDDFSFIQRDGMLNISFTGGSTELRTTWETINIGFLMLEKNFSEFISISGEKTKK